MTKSMIVVAGESHFTHVVRSNETVVIFPNAEQPTGGSPEQCNFLQNVCIGPGGGYSKKFPLRSRLVNCVSCPISVGIVPESLFPLRSRLVNCFSCPISVGMVPESSLLLRSSHPNCVSCPISVGIVPESGPSRLREVMLPSVLQLTDITDEQEHASSLQPLNFGMLPKFQWS